MKEVAQLLINISSIQELWGKDQKKHAVDELVRLQLRFCVDGLQESDVHEKTAKFRARRQRIQAHFPQSVWLCMENQMVTFWAPFHQHFVDDLKAQIIYTDRSWDPAEKAWSCKVEAWPVLRQLLEQYYTNSMFIVYNSAQDSYARVFYLEHQFRSMFNGQSR